MLKNLIIHYSVAFLLLEIFIACKNENKIEWKSIEVNVSAYNSVASQTNGNPNIGAWGDSLTNSMRSVAISRDLLALGIKHNTMVKIDGLPGVYYVRDKMAKRWSKRIDIHMGDDIEKAKKWGVKKLKILYAIENKKTSNSKSNLETIK